MCNQAGPRTAMVRTFAVSAGILEHKQRMGAAIWEFHYPGDG